MESLTAWWFDPLCWFSGPHYTPWDSIRQLTVSLSRSNDYFFLLSHWPCLDVTPWSLRPPQTPSQSFSLSLAWWASWDTPQSPPSSFCFAWLHSASSTCHLCSTSKDFSSKICSSKFHFLIMEDRNFSNCQILYRGRRLYLHSHWWREVQVVGEVIWTERSEKLWTVRSLGSFERCSTSQCFFGSRVSESAYLRDLRVFGEKEGSKECSRICLWGSRRHLRLFYKLSLVPKRFVNAVRH